MNFEIIFSALSENLLVLNQDLIIIAISDGLINFFQITRPSIIGKPVWEFYALMTRDQNTPEFETFLDSFYHAKKLNKIYTSQLLQFEIKNSKGVVTTIQWIPKITPLMNEEGNHSYILHLDDCTQQLKLEKTLRFLEKELSKPSVGKK